MNVFTRELKAHRKGLFFWSLGMIFLVASGVAKFYGYSSSGTTSINKVLEMFPHSMQVLFGLNGFDLSKPSGIYGILFMYIVVTAAIHAVLLGTDLIAKEERDKTAEFLYSKPISRARVVSQKLLAGLFNLVVLNVITLVTSLLIFSYYSKSNAGTGDILLMDAALFMTQLLFMTLGSAIAAATKHARKAAGIATAVLLTTFILYFIINLSGNINYLYALSPFEYFNARDLLAKGQLDPVYTSLAVGLVATSVVMTYRSYRHRDLS